MSWTGFWYGNIMFSIHLNVSMRCDTMWFVFFLSFSRNACNKCQIKYRVFGRTLQLVRRSDWNRPDFGTKTHLIYKSDCDVRKKKQKEKKKSTLFVWMCVLNNPIGAIWLDSSNSQNHILFWILIGLVF